MKRYVAFLRGMNLGRRRIKNGELCALSRQVSQLGPGASEEEPKVEIMHLECIIATCVLLPHPPRSAGGHGFPRKRG